MTGTDDGSDEETAGTGSAGGAAGEGNDTDTADEGFAGDAAGQGTQLWLVERTYSDDEQNIIILVYATLDGKRYHRKERAITSFSSGIPDVTAAVTVDENRIGAVSDEETRERYAEAAGRMAAEHDPDDVV